MHSNTKQLSDLLSELKKWACFKVPLLITWLALPTWPIHLTHNSDRTVSQYWTTVIVISFFCHKWCWAETFQIVRHFLSPWVSWLNKKCWRNFPSAKSLFENKFPIFFSKKTFWCTTDLLFLHMRQDFPFQMKCIFFPVCFQIYFNQWIDYFYSKMNEMILF